MEYEFNPDKVDELLEKLGDDDKVIVSGADFRIMIDKVRKKSKGRKPISFDEEHFDEVIRRWKAGEMTARAAMSEVGLKPNTFYRRVKERYENIEQMTKEVKKEIKKEIKTAAKELKQEEAAIKAAQKDALKEAKKEEKEKTKTKETADSEGEE